ncbi:ABC-F family ATP-binding cassette domain-containing protein [Pseudochrobactrum sp. MP213Fo]|uniref:ABC-F family ATP-binding cassette domain-containing protein n=1 Tax=Pseudochrobactrum sp. MP213Fo TaxID=3022250 RepID=UPI003BA36CC5
MVPLTALLTLQNLAAHTPDGRSLFQNFNLSIARDRIGLIGRNGVGKSTLLRIIAGEIAPLNGSVRGHATIGVLHQVTDQSHETIADLFGARAALMRMEHILAGHGSEDNFEADWTLEARIEDALVTMGLSGLTPHTELCRLSGGQKTGAALAALIFKKPDLLLLDEPTNNLDYQGRQAVLELLHNWRGGALVISHDRALLRKMDRIVEMTFIGVSHYEGNWDFYEARKAEELAGAHHDFEVAQTAVKQAEKQARLIRERQEKRDAAGKKSRFKSGQSKLLLDAREDRAQATSGRNTLLAHRQADAGQQALKEAQSKIERLTPHDFTIASAQLPASKIVLTANGVGFAYSSGKPVFEHVSLQITGPERLAVCGGNGSGKTTLLRVLAGQLEEKTGIVHRFVRFSMLDQHVSMLDDYMSVVENFKQHNPQASDNACRAALARFMFRNDCALRKAGELSGGERLRAGLACVLGGIHVPQLLILDEPTNHLDIVALRSVEAALKAYDGALLVTSHDEAFLEAISVTRRLKIESISLSS